MGVLYAVLGLIALFLAVILIRAARFRPKEEERPAAAPVEVSDGAADRLAQMIRLKTVSNRDLEQIDEAPFAEFRALLETLYPKVTAACTRERFGRSGLLYHWKGKNNGDPTVLMAHYDVVPSDGEGWTHPPFSGELDENGVLWGRGTLDTKGTLCGILEAAEVLLQQGFVPENDVYFSFGGDEEVMGPSCPAIVDALEARGIHPALVVDEGGAVVEGAFPGVHKKTAMVGVCEKGQMFLEFTGKSAGGHTSAPPPRSAVQALCRAVTRLEDHPAPAKRTPAADAMFDTLGRHSGFGLRLVFANLWCFWPLLKSICTKAGGELNATVRTTCSFTRMEGSFAFNVFPVTAKLGADVRILPGESREEVLARIRETVADPSIAIQEISGCEPSASSPAEGEAWERLTAAICGTWPEAVVSPYMMVARSDSSNYCRVSGSVYRFSAMELSKEERGKIHGIDECIPVEKLQRAAAFFTRLLAST